MTYARIENGEIVEYPVYEGDIRLRFATADPPISFGQGEYFDPPKDYVRVEDIDPPTADHTKEIVEDLPALVDGKLQRAWAVVDAPPEKVAVREAALEQQRFRTAQAELDAFARERGYDGILDACSYASSSHPVFAEQARICLDMRDKVRVALADGKDMPTLEWPA